MVDRVVIYGKDRWPYTQAAREAFKQKGIGVEYADVLKDKAKLAEMLKHSQDQRRVPVIVDGGKVAIGFNGGSWKV